MLRMNLPAGLALALIVGSAWAQTAQKKPAFDVASIKKNKVDMSNLHRQCTCSPAGKLSVSDVPVKGIIAWAYIDGLTTTSPRFSVPDWAASLEETYNIEAKAEGSVSFAQCKAMTQQLLEDRFKLKLHRESRAIPVYLLVQAKSGSKLHEVKDDTSSEPGEGIRLRGFKLPKVKGWEMWMLATYLGQLPSLGRPVVDRTGYKGTFEFSLDFSYAPGDDRPSIFTAVQEQLGLKLEPARAPVDFLMIDHIEEPSEN